jgi:gliding motility-associated-like protein
MLDEENFISFFISFHLFYFSQGKQANDCVNYIQVCGNQQIELNPIGFGVQEIEGTPCYGKENNSLWLRFTAKTSGTLGFDLIPLSRDQFIDYDFWIFGPDVTCGNLGSTIRCSTTNPIAANVGNRTGMRDSEPDGYFFEGPGKDGHGYVKSLNVEAGESYFMVIDRPIGDGEFKLNWTGTALLVDPFRDAPFSFNEPPEINVCFSNSIFDFSTLSENILNGNPDFMVGYYLNLDDASYDQNRIDYPFPIISGIYFYRIQSKTTECFQVGKITVNNQNLILHSGELRSCNIGGKGVFNLNDAVFTAEDVQSIKYYSTSFDAQNQTPNVDISPNNYSSRGEVLYARITTKKACVSIQPLNLILYNPPNLDVTKYDGLICDDNFTGTGFVKFSDITPKIIEDTLDFTARYFLSNNPTFSLPNDFSFTSPVTINVEIKSKNGCPSVFGKINLDFKKRILLNAVLPVDACALEGEKSKEFNLGDYASLFTTNATLEFYDNLENAKNKIGKIAALQTISSDKTYYLRFENSTDCPQIGELQLLFKHQKKSNILVDKTICEGTKTDLEAGLGFDSYLWDNGSTKSNSGQVGIGEHWVELKSTGGCNYRQYVKVLKANDVIIQEIKVEKKTIIVNVSGGTAPYQYSLDGINFQSSNIFTKIATGLYTLYVTSEDNCKVITKEFLNINLLNVITPNGDNYNKDLDFSILNIKEDVKFKVYDQYGKLIFNATNNVYKWDGKNNGRFVATGTYWYILSWTEPDTNEIKIYQSWVLVKNR